MKKCTQFLGSFSCCVLLVSASAPGDVPGRHTAGGRYKPGHYPLADGTRRAGQLRSYVSHTDFLTKIEVEPKEGQVSQVLGPAELRSAVIGADSMVTIRLTELVDSTKKASLTDLAHLVMVGKATLLMRHEWSAGAPGMTTAGPYGTGMMTGGGDGVATRWGYQKAGTARCYLLPWTDDDFKKHVAPLFLDYPHLCQRIRNGEASRNDIKRIFYAYNLKADIDQVSYEQAEAACRYLVFK